MEAAGRPRPCSRISHALTRNPTQPSKRIRTRADPWRVYADPRTGWSDRLNARRAVPSKRTTSRGIHGIGALAGLIPRRVTACRAPDICQRSQVSGESVPFVQPIGDAELG
jgi:hypothetical protein